jgi:hypothetical protein
MEPRREKIGAAAAPDNGSSSPPALEGVGEADDGEIRHFLRSGRTAAASAHRAAAHTTMTFITHFLFVR